MSGGHNIITCHAVSQTRAENPSSLSAHEEQQKGLWEADKVSASLNFSFIKEQDLDEFILFEQQKFLE